MTGAAPTSAAPRFLPLGYTTPNRKSGSKTESCEIKFPRRKSVLIVTSTEYLKENTSQNSLSAGLAGLTVSDLGRDGKIRTYDPLYPKQVRYQTAPRPEPCVSLSGLKAFENP